MDPRGGQRWRRLPPRTLFSPSPALTVPSDFTRLCRNFFRNLALAFCRKSSVMWSDPEPMHGTHARKHVGRSFEVFLRVFLCPSTVAAAQSLSFSLVAAPLSSPCTPTTNIHRPSRRGANCRPTVLSESDGQLICNLNRPRMRRRWSLAEIHQLGCRCPSPCLPSAHQKVSKRQQIRRLSLFNSLASFNDRLLRCGHTAAANLLPLCRFWSRYMRALATSPSSGRCRITVLQLQYYSSGFGP